MSKEEGRPEKLVLPPAARGDSVPDVPVLSCIYLQQLVLGPELSVFIDGAFRDHRRDVVMTVERVQLHSQT